MAADEILNIGIDVDIKAATQQMAKFQKAVLKHMQSVTKAIDKMGKSSDKMTKDAVEGTEEWGDATDDVGKRIASLQDQIPKMGKDQQKFAKAYTKALEDQQKLLKGQGGGKKKGQSLKEAKEFAKKMEEAGQNFVGEIEGFLTKDAKGLVDKLGGYFKKASMKMGGGLMKGGSKLQEVGAGMKDRAASKGSGSAMGSMMGGLGKAMGAIGKLGPLLSVAATAMMSVVKMFIDAEAAAKEFQKGVLQSASTLEFLGQGTNDVTSDFLTLEETMKGVRDAAFDFMGNYEMGITSDTHKAVLNTLNQEGVSLKRMATEAGKGSEAAKKYATELVHVNVAYSRAFGAPISEISQMQGEMFTEMGMGLDETKLAFEQVARSASGSGIASNKFFSMIRGVSQDLSLYNLRIEDAAKLLGKLGKVMNPRSAQKFMQTISGMMKTMDIDSRMRLSLMGGEKGAAALEKDVAHRAKNLHADLGKALKMDPKDVAKTLMNPKAAALMWKKLGKEKPEQVGALRQSASRLAEAQGAKGKGPYGKAVAMRHMSMAGTMESLMAGLGGKKIGEARGGLAFEKKAQMLNLDEDALEGMADFQNALEDQRQLLLGEAKGDKKKTAEIIAMDSFDLLDEMTQAQKDALPTQKKVRDFAQEQTSLQQSMLDKLGILIDFLMNQFFNVVMDLWEAVATMAPEWAGGKDKGTMKAKREVYESKDPALIKAFQDSMKDGKLDKEGFKGRLASGKTGSRMSNLLSESAEGRTQAQGLDTSGRAGGVIKQIMAQVGGAGEVQNMASMAGVSDKKQADLKAQLYKTEHREATGSRREGTYQAAGDYQVETGVDPLKAMKDAGFEPQEIANTLSKALWQAGGDPMKQAKLGGAVAAVPLSKEEKAIQEAALEQDKKALAEAAKTSGAVTSKSSIYIHYSDGFYRKFKRDREKSMFKVMRTALFEHFMMSQLKPEEVAKAMAEKGMKAETFAKEILKRAEAGEAPGEFLNLEQRSDKDTPDISGLSDEDKAELAKKLAAAKKAKETPTNAAGGIVTSVSGGLATVRAAAGEGLASVGVDERIVGAGRGRGGPGGGGAGGAVEIRLRGDARKMFEAVAVNTYHDMQRKAQTT